MSEEDDDVELDLTVMELENITEIDMCEVSLEALKVLREAVAIRWELRPMENQAGFRLIAHANLGFKRAGYVVMSD